MISGNLRRTVLTLVLIVLTASLAACQAGAAPAAPTALPASATVPPAAKSTAVPAVTTVPTATASPTATTAPTNTPTPKPGVFWVDPTHDLGEISPYVLGVNHGPWSDLGLANIEPAKVAGVTFLRWPGGNYGDTVNVTPLMVDNFIAQARNLIHAEPSISIRLPNNNPESAAAVVRYTNIDKKYGVKWWSIGNEPNLFSKNPAFKTFNWTPVSYAKLWREFALAMKKADPTIKLIGPDINQFKLGPTNDPNITEGLAYLTEFLKLNSDLVDVVAVHRYPFPKCNTCSPAPAEELFKNVTEWDSLFTDLRKFVHDVTGKDYPVALTEFNSYWSNAQGGDATPDSLNGALWDADVLGRMIRQRPEILAFWTFKDGNSGLGMMTSYENRPSYYVYQIYKRFGNHLLAATSDDPMVSVFAAKKDDGTLTLIFVNLNIIALKKPLQVDQGDGMKLTEAYLLDQDHKEAPSIPPPGFQNGDPVELPARSVTLFILKP